MHFTELDLAVDESAAAAARKDAEEGREALGSGDLEALDAALEALAKRFAEDEVDDEEYERVQRIYGALFGELLCARVAGEWGTGTLYGMVVPAGLLLGPRKLKVWPRLEIRKRISGRAASLVERADSLVRNATADAPGPAPERLYRLGGDQGYFDAGVVGDGRQVLMAAFYTGTFAIFFDADGNFDEYATHGPDSLSDDPRPDHYGPDKRHLREWQEKLGFEAQTIQVQRFWVSQQSVGIEDMPGFYVDFLEDPESEEPEERKHMLEDIRQWIESESFVLYWGNDLWLDGGGRVTSS